MQNIDIVAVEGEVLVEGSLENGDILIDIENSYFQYQMKGVMLVDSLDHRNDSVINALDIQLEIGDYNVNEFVGKILVKK